jgi:hypothetical protein
MTKPLLTLLALVPLAGPPAPIGLDVYTDASALDGPQLRPLLGRQVIVIREVERLSYRGDWSIVRLAETDDLVGIDAPFPWWELSYEFDDAVVGNPRAEHTATVKGVLAGRGGRWVIDHAKLVRWE